MASEFLRKWYGGSKVWLTASASIVLAFISGVCYAIGSTWWILPAVLSIFCVVVMMRRINRIGLRMHYLINATLSGDFSYKFPVSGVNTEEKDVNELLNRIVEHFERLTRESRQNEVFLHRMINLTDIGLAIADSNGNIRLHNESALRLLDRQALTHICQIPDQIKGDVAIYKREVTVDDRSFTLFTISDLRRQMQAVEVESWEKLTRVLTHEIMNSLTPIQSIAETMRGKTQEPEVNDAFATISSSSASLMEFVRIFREFNRLPEPRMKVIYVKPLLKATARMAENYRSDPKAYVSLTCFPPDLMLYTDETLLRQVVLNILKNAIEANAENIEIEAAVKADESVEIKITNDGDPISEETAEHIFTPFFTTRKKGSGIGLSLSRRIISHLGGSLSFKSHPLTCFSIRI